MKKLLLLASTLYLQAFFIQADVVVIGNPAIKAKLSDAEVKNIFLGKRQSLPDGTKISILEQAPEGPVRVEFHNQYTKKTQSQLHTYWMRLVFTGKGKLPKEATDSKSVIDAVASNPNVIGYVKSSEVNDKVVVLTK